MTSTSRGKSSGRISRGGLDDVRGHVGDLLLGELILECGHSAAAVQDLLVRLLGGGLRLVEVGATVPDVPAAEST